MNSFVQQQFSITRGNHDCDLLRQETLANILDSTAQSYPDHPALIFKDQQINYQMLNDSANLIAHHLIERGVRSGDIVGLWLPRGIELLVAQAGITKAGAAWLPFDMDVPVDRIQVCLDDASAVGIVTSPEWFNSLEHLNQPIWTDQQLLAPTTSILNKPQHFLPSHPAYVIYTSGSTGKPKGIVINQGSISHFLRSENSVLGIQHSDKVYQGFSVAFDMSFEEIWISYLVGATLWIAPKELVTDPEQLCKTLQQENITVLHAVPTLLALFPHDVANLRIINLGGEMCPDALVERWALPHHQLFNTYGPTEATVSASLAQLQQGQPVTIGKPLPNYGLLVMSDSFELLPQGETGELCIFGPGVAAGYLGRPDLTAEKFIANPWAESEKESRLYRTGDLARLNEYGQIECLGRADDQVKIRGFRVELGEIEAALCDQEGVGTAAVILRSEDGIEQLIAFLVEDIDTKQALDIKNLRNTLKARLPAYMIPSRIEVIAYVPRLLSGKIDRKALRVLPLQTVLDREASDEPQNAAEEILFHILSKLFPNTPIQLDADFFDDLGGHSLLAAILISHLREYPQYSHLTIQHIYQNRRVGAIAQLMLEQLKPSNESTHIFDQQNPRNHTYRLVCGLAQLLVIPLLISINILQWLAPFFTYHYLTGSPNDQVSHAILASLGVYVLSIILSFTVSISLKRLLLIGIKAGSYPLWGLTYFRWWFADRLTDISPMYLLAGSSLNNLYLKSLGAKIGHDVTIGSVHIRMPSLLYVEDGVSIGAHVNLENAKVEHGQLVLGSIHLKKESYVGSYAVIEENTVLAQYAHVNALSAISYGSSIPEYEIWDGAPAKKVGMIDLTQRPIRPALSAFRKYVEYIYYACSTLIIACIFFTPIFPTFIIVDWLDTHLFAATTLNNHVQTALYYFFLAIPASALMIIVTALISATIRKMLFSQMQEGTYPVHGQIYYKKWFATQILETSLAVLRGLFATVYAPSWFRLLGAKVGKYAEISTATGVVPELLTLGDESFIADAVMLGDEEIKSGWMTLQSTYIGHRSFVGNSAYIADGTHLPDGVLIGVQSKAPDSATIKSGETWFGSPALRLPARENMNCFAENLTFKPSLSRRLMRGFIEGLRIVLPLALAIGMGYMIVLDVIEISVADGLLAGFGMLAFAGLLYGLGCFLIVTIMKWIMIGRYQPHAAPMWTMFVWLSEGVTSLYEAVAVPNFLNYLRGTPLLPFFLRLLGTKIGKDVYLDTTDITEFDCVHIGDRSELNSFSGPQTHLFEDRIMKIGNVHIGDDVTINTRSIVLYSAEIGDRSVLGPLTLVMKGEKIPSQSAWIGSPAVPWRY